MRIELSLIGLRRGLFLILAAVIFCGLGVEIWEKVFHPNDHFQLVAYLSLSYEANVPTWVSSCLLFACAVVLALIARAREQEHARYIHHWWVLSFLFAYISLDELVRIHEHMNGWFHFDGVLYFGWVIPAGITVGLLGISYLGFLAHLPRSTAVRFIVAGAVYVGGALGVELLLGYWVTRAGDGNIVYSLIDLVEESMEMIGASLFLMALLRVLAGSSGTIQIVLQNENHQASAREDKKSDRAEILSLAAAQSKNRPVPVETETDEQDRLSWG